MPGSFDVTPGPVPLARPGKVIAAFLYNGPDADADHKYALLSNVRVLSIDAPKMGADPGSARFRYAFGDPLGSPGDPQRFEQVYPLDAPAGRFVRNDDRIVVRGFNSDGSSVLLFDGFAAVPQVDLNAQSEAVTFEAFGTPVREWDKPLGGALMRDADDPLAVGADIKTERPARFNPDGHPDAGPASDVGDPTRGTHRPFLGPVWPKNQINGKTINPWTLIDAARYVIRQGNPNETYVGYGNLTDLTAGLVAIVPTTDDGAIDFADATTYTIEDIEVEDTDVRGAAWPEALEKLLSPYDFAMRFKLEEDSNGDPKWTLEITRRDDLKRIKSLYLQRAGNPYDPRLTNVRELRLARDIGDLANQIRLDTDPVYHECSFLVVPLFHVDPADATNPDQFNGEDAPADKYRLFGFDECGEGHWDRASNSWVTGQFGFLSPLLDPKPDQDAGPPFVIRRRPAKSGKLLTLGADGKPLKALLHVSKDYLGDAPGVWDGSSGTWQAVDLGWQLLDDRLGFRVTADKPNMWRIGDAPEGKPSVYDGGMLPLVEPVATPDTTAGRPYPIFRLTCVIEADVGMGILAKRRRSSPTRFPVERRVDTSDRFRKRVVSKFSAAIAVGYRGERDKVESDDTDEAKRYANALRKAHEAGTFAGSVTLNGIRLSYDVGDKVDAIIGRNVSLRQNLGAGQGESPQYPTVVAVRWDFDGEQRTTLALQDLRAEPPPRRRKVREEL